jgi:hypothetical protein
MKTTRLCNHWQGMPFSERAKLPASPGIYAAKVGTDIVYIGRSVNIRNRWKRHTRHKEFASLDKKHGLEVLWQLHPADSLAEIEGAMIKKIKPVMNGNDGLFSPKRVDPVTSLADAKWRPLKTWIDPWQPYGPMEKLILEILSNRIRMVNFGQGHEINEVWAEFKPEFFAFSNIATPIQMAAFYESLGILVDEGVVQVSDCGQKYALVHQVNVEVA